MITLRLFGHETDANHFREEGRPAHLDRRGRLYDWRNDLRPLTMRRLLEPWTTIPRAATPIGKKCAPNEPKCCTLCPLFLVE